MYIKHTDLHADHIGSEWPPLCKVDDNARIAVVVSCMFDKRGLTRAVCILIADARGCTAISPGLGQRSLLREVGRIA